MGLQEKIKEIEYEMSRTQKNKATEYHLGTLKAKIAKLRSQIIEGETKAASGPAGEGFDVQKHGDARIAMIGFPSVGKSSILNYMTDTKSEAAAYEFTTLTCIPGVLKINDAKL
jgi:ribosome-interacting GTPase 1